MAEASEAVDLEALAEEMLEQARGSGSGRLTRLFRAVPGGSLSQILLVLLEGRELSEHENPGQALLHTLRGRTELIAGDQRWELPAHSHIVIPEVRHSLVALEDSVVLLTVVRGD